MKKMCVLLLIICCTNLSAEDINKDICNGLVYQQTIIEGQQPLVIHALYADPRKVAIKGVHATGKALSREPVSSMVERTGARAGINGGFFRRVEDLMEIHCDC